MVSIASFQTESDSFNVIPQRVRLRGTVRTLDTAVQDLVEERIKTLVTRTAEAYGAKAVVDYVRNYPVMINDPLHTTFAIEAARRITPEVEEMADLIMGAEDFSFMLNECPGAYILVGNGDTAAVHHPAYNFNDEAIPVGCSFWAEIVEGRLPMRA